MSWFRALEFFAGVRSGVIGSEGKSWWVVVVVRVPVGWGCCSLGAFEAPSSEESWVFSHRECRLDWRSPRGSSSSSLATALDLLLLAMMDRRLTISSCAW